MKRSLPLRSYIPLAIFIAVILVTGIVLAVQSLTRPKPSEGVAVATSSTTTSSAAPVTSSTSTTPTPSAPTPVAVECDTASYDTIAYSRYQAAWVGKHSHCEAKGIYSVQTDAEKQALTAAYGAEGTLSSLAVLYGLCAANSPTAYPVESGPSGLSPNQMPEATGMLTLCPDHPQAAAIKATLAKSQQREAQRKEGRVFGGGVLLVGKEVKPGTYAASNGKGCYWERQDSSGGIIENGFHVNAARVVATITPSDYAFMSESCGEWSPAS